MAKECLQRKQMRQKISPIIKIISVLGKIYVSTLSMYDFIACKIIFIVLLYINLPICNVCYRSSTDESSKNDGASETSVETPRKTPGDGMNYRETDNGVINKRQNRLQPMVMVWNTYFPNGKMIPLRQPQPPVYFGPAMTGNSNEQQLSTESVQLQQPQQVMKPSSSNHHHRYHHSQCNHRMNVIPIPETDENSNSEGSPNDVNRVSNNISHSSVSPAVFSTIQQSQQVIGAV